MVNYKYYMNSNFKIEKCNTWEDALELAAGDYKDGSVYPHSISEGDRVLQGKNLINKIIKYYNKYYGEY